MFIEILAAIYNYDLNC